MGRRVWLVRIGISLLLGFISGAPASSQWKEWLLFNNAVRFGVKDPQFGQDVSLYVFRLPFLTFVVDWLFAAFVIILIVTAVAYYLNGGIRLQVQHRRVSAQVKLHISMLLAVLALLKAVGYWLARYELTASTRGAVKGATYTDVNAQLPALELLAIISLSLLKVASIFGRRLGAGSMQFRLQATFRRRVTRRYLELPLAWPGVLTASILTFAHTLGEFGVVLMVGGNLPGQTRTLSVAIYDRMQAFDDRSAGVMAATLLAISVATLMATTALSRRVNPSRG